jgi:hypothetical protein
MPEQLEPVTTLAMAETELQSPPVETQSDGKASLEHVPAGLRAHVFKPGWAGGPGRPRGNAYQRALAVAELIVDVAAEPENAAIIRRALENAVKRSPLQYVRVYLKEAAVLLGASHAGRGGGGVVVKLVIGISEERL